ncbi:MAG: hypothetical protein ACR2JY_15080 [Chloroflexota bacterium]
MQYSRSASDRFALLPLKCRGSLSWRTTFRQSVRSALAALFLYRLRSALLLLDIAVGVCGVLLTTALAQFAANVTRAANAQLGATVVTVLPTAPIINGKVANARGPTLTVDDLTGPPCRPADPG